MHDRQALGPADVDDVTLTGMVADLLGHDPAAVRLICSTATPVDYDIPAISTVSRHWVHGEAETPGGRQPYRLFVKHIQAWHHSPFFAFVPEEAREFAKAKFPWRIEPAVYRSDLPSVLPPGLGAPRALGVFDLEPDAAAVWLEAVQHPPVDWTLERYERAAYLLGRFAARPEIVARTGLAGFEWTVFDYLYGRVAAQVVPEVLGEEAWQRDEVREHFDPELRERLQQAAGRLEAITGELVRVPKFASHGDACPNNLLPGTDPDSFTLIDFGFFLDQPVGFDLGQLIAGNTQLGLGPWDRLGELDERCLTAYLAGTAEEGVTLDPALVRRAHALQLLLFAGISSLPEPGMTPAQSAARAALARHSLDLLDATS
ncbi:hypothetical protein GIS00_16850 [Nakamurella sp. YIM 132087]|uniref:Aminoglycoside phosphotransferase domain-containing protein n=1 Tax=Nakamurella alba TaxID=2665158 RepID=A0A7K1FS05_9ACTN|nr:phosphotransferase [Nakamurella alba]MTD15604.1 hypothetical protein [Nakamurella alba]